VRFVRRNRQYQGWGLHIWGDVAQETEWHKPIPPSGHDNRSVYWDIPLSSEEKQKVVGFEVHLSGVLKGARGELPTSEVAGGDVEAWLVESQQQARLQPKGSPPPDLSKEMPGNLNKACAIWVSKDIIAWRHALMDTDGPRTFTLHASQEGAMYIKEDGLQGSEQQFKLENVSNSLPAELAEQWPYLAGCSALRVPPEALSQVQQLVQGELAVTMHSATGEAMDATCLQMQGGIDAFFKYDGPLGCWWDESKGTHTVAVWAPTAQTMELLHFTTPHGGEPTVMPMARNALGAGVWSVDLPKGASWWTYYKFRLKVWCPWTLRHEISEATDPYARGLSANGERVWVVPTDLEHESLVPQGWHEHSIPRVKQWTDISLYELHIRDFSIADESVPPHLRGKYLAFDPERVKQGNGGKESSGLAHLAKLREAGLNHIHLLPLYDFGSVPEWEEEQLKVEEDLSQYPPDSDKQQAAVLAVADQDGFNWGYDPVHWGVPDGSYASNPDGAARIRECREMIMALHKQGWGVVLDVVYNHVYAAGPNDRNSVLDKLVPGYYQRRDEDGTLCQSTCCNNVATEHYMAERLSVEDLVHWAKHYKVDGFRFDIMGHMLLRTLNKMRAALDGLTVEKDGVDGKRIYIYGEAWNFGEVVDNQRGINCSQLNLTGTGLGGFNDRLRDGALGGGPFSPPDLQGFVTGLSLAPNESTGQGDVAAQAQELLVLSDWVRYALAGNLSRYKMETANGKVLAGGEAQAMGVPLAYGGQPCEHVAFIGCHDNLTMFDFITEKAAPNLFAEERVRMQIMCLSLITLSQGVPFVHAGDDILRSKSLDRDSYNSGDWFNAIDWTCSTHKLGIGLPVRTKNEPGWFYKAPILTNKNIRPSPDQMKACNKAFRELLRIRYSSPLFRLPTEELIQKHVTFANTGPNQVPGIIMMLLSSGDQGSEAYDPEFEHILVVFNASPEPKELQYPAPLERLSLHPVQQDAALEDDEMWLKGCAAHDEGPMVEVPPRTTAVFVTTR